MTDYFLYFCRCDLQQRCITVQVVVYMPSDMLNLFNTPSSVGQCLSEDWKQPSVSVKPITDSATDLVRTFQVRCWGLDECVECFCAACSGAGTDRAIRGVQILALLKFHPESTLVFLDRFIAENNLTKILEKDARVLLFTTMSTAFESLQSNPDEISVVPKMSSDQFKSIVATMLDIEVPIVESIAHEATDVGSEVESSPAPPESMEPSINPKRRKLDGGGERRQDGHEAESPIGTAVKIPTAVPLTASGVNPPPLLSTMVQQLPTKPSTPNTDKQDRPQSALMLLSVDLEGETALLYNSSAEDVCLGGYTLSDAIGRHVSAPLQTTVVVRGKQGLTFWTAPHSKVHRGPPQEDAENVFWRNQGDGLPRAAPVLNDSGDGLRLVSPDGAVVASVSRCKVQCNHSTNAGALPYSDVNFTGLNTRQEFATLSNSGTAEVDLQGCYLKDKIGHHESLPFGAEIAASDTPCGTLPAYVIRPGGSVDVWTAPRHHSHTGPTTEDACDWFWRNKLNGQPRAAPLLNDDGDGLSLMAPTGETICTISSGLRPGPVSIGHHGSSANRTESSVAVPKRIGGSPVDNDSATALVTNNHEGVAESDGQGSPSQHGNADENRDSLHRAPAAVGTKPTHANTAATGSDGSAHCGGSDARASPTTADGTSSNVHRLVGKSNRASGVSSAQCLQTDSTPSGLAKTDSRSDDESTNGGVASSKNSGIHATQGNLSMVLSGSSTINRSDGNKTQEDLPRDMGVNEAANNSDARHDDGGFAATFALAKSGHDIPERDKADSTENINSLDTEDDTMCVDHSESAGEGSSDSAGSNLGTNSDNSSTDDDDSDNNGSDDDASDIGQNDNSDVVESGTLHDSAIVGSEDEGSNKRSALAESDGEAHDDNDDDSDSDDRDGIDIDHDNDDDDDNSTSGDYASNPFHLGHLGAYESENSFFSANFPFAQLYPSTGTGTSAAQEPTPVQVMTIDDSDDD
eukprot:m.1359545 g.1359545  ORF g.1359545 m.1359545 type:complete len:974 (+) comp24938_c0_seq9:166-3087(+)